jgi:hypothetical protein
MTVDRIAESSAEGFRVDQVTATTVTPLTRQDVYMRPLTAKTVVPSQWR